MTDGRSPVTRTYSSAPRDSTAKRKALSVYSPPASPYRPSRSKRSGASMNTGVTLPRDAGDAARAPGLDVPLARVALFTGALTTRDRPGDVFEDATFDARLAG